MGMMVKKVNLSMHTLERSYGPEPGAAPDQTGKIDSSLTPQPVSNWEGGAVEGLLEAVREHLKNSTWCILGTLTQFL